jgi:hypothetical protein
MNFGDFPGTLGVRDAIHQACISVVSTVTVEPGQSIRFRDVDKNLVELCARHERQGIVDPFLPFSVPPGKVFLMLVKPDLVQGIRHNFDIKGIPEPKPEINPQIEEEDDWEIDRRRCKAEGCED